MRRSRIAIIVIVSIFLISAAVFVWIRFAARAQHFSIRVNEFHESAEALDNPGRGFYIIDAFYVQDDAVPKLDAMDDGLVLVEINLAEYREGPISRKGLDAIDNYLSLFRDGRRLMVRFLYDWDGEGPASEPESLDIILNHMKQVGPIIKDHAGSIFTLQGLFTGSWAEMHSTAFGSDEDVRTLARTLFEATEGAVYMAVRTPVQWRAATGNGIDVELAAKLGLYNDGMFGSDTDFGTYSNGREFELSFQNILCRSVPNGGEAVGRDTLSDFENAVSELSKARVSYLNGQYDPETLAKWKSVTVSDGSVFDGLDGLSYIERRLGYRLWISDVDVSADFLRGRLKMSVDIRNSGFAPPYFPMEVIFTVRNIVTGESYSASADCSLSGLTGGESADRTWRTGLSMPLERVETGVWAIYVDFRDKGSDESIALANDALRWGHGYWIATVIGAPVPEK